MFGIEFLRKRGMKRTNMLKRARRLVVEGLENRIALTSIAGSVYHDVDGDNLLDGNDRGIPGVTVTLQGIEKGTNKVVQLTRTTDRLGSYSFDGIKKGTYSIGASQVATLLDGNEQAGTGGGTVQNDLISNIDVERNNDALTGYLFGEFSPASLRGHAYLDLDRDGNFDSGDSPLANVTVQLSGTDDRGSAVSLALQTQADGSYAFTDLRPGRYALAGSQPSGYTDGRDTIGRFDDNPHPVPDNGVLHNDQFSDIVLAAGRRGRNYQFGEFDDLVNNGILATTFDKTLVIDGTSAGDHFEFIAGETEHTVLLNGVAFTAEAAVHTRFIFYGHGGDNTAHLTGGAGVDQVEIRQSSSKLTGTTYQVLIYSTRSVTAQAGGGADRAMFYDTAGNETWAADPAGATLTGSDFTHSAFDFHRAYAYATTGTDTATFTGSDGDDRFTASATDARMEGVSYYNYGRGFDVVHGYAGNGSDDRAYLHDSAGNDSFVATPTEARLSGPGYDNNAHGFDRLYAFATGGTDDATFYDSQRMDTYKVDSEGARMFASTYYNRAVGFDSHQAYFSANDGQQDSVEFFDSANNDSFFAVFNRFTAYRDGKLHRVTDPDVVTAHASTGTDRYYSILPTFQLVRVGDWESYFWTTSQVA